MPANSLISADQTFAVWSVMFGLAAFGFWCERFAWGRKFTGLTLLILASIALANLRIIPTSAPAYDIVWDYLVPVAIAVLLFDTNLSKILREAGTTLIAFGLGIIGVLAGVLAARAIFNLGANEAAMAGIFTGTYIGGGLNFAAVANATDMQESSYLAAAIAADNVITSLHMIVVVFLPGLSLLLRHFNYRYATASASNVVSEAEGDSSVGMTSILLGLTVAFAVTAIGNAIAAALEVEKYSILIVTLLALFLASAFPTYMQKIKGTRQLGTALMFVFLASVGASADVWALIGLAPVLFVFASTIVTVHLLVILLLGRLLRLDLAEILIASVVCIGGPASAPALASAKGWQDLIVPGVLAGSLGYAVGSFFGVSIATLGA